MYGYGGFNVSTTPSFNALRLALLEHGFVYASVEHARRRRIRRGVARRRDEDEKAERVRRLHRRAEWLIAKKYTTPAQAGDDRASNGGLLVGAVMNQRPELFGVAVPQVGVMDMLRFHKFTIGWNWIADYGSSDDPDEFKALYAYSPLHNIRAGVKISRHTHHHGRSRRPRRSRALVQVRRHAAGACERRSPALIRIETKSGHGAVSTTKLDRDDGGYLRVHPAEPGDADGRHPAMKPPTTSREPYTSAAPSTSSSPFGDATLRSRGAHGLREGLYGSRDRHSGGIGARFPECDGDLLVALLQLEPGDDGLPIGGTQLLEGGLVALNPFPSNGFFERRRREVGVAVAKLGRSRPAVDASNFVADMVGDGLTEIGLKGARVSGFKAFQPWQRADDGVLHKILGIGRAARPMGKPTSGPALQWRQGSFDQQADRLVVALFEAFEQVDSARKGCRFRFWSIWLRRRRSLCVSPCVSVALASYS